MLKELESIKQVFLEIKSNSEIFEINNIIAEDYQDIVSKIKQKFDALKNEYQEIIVNATLANKIMSFALVDCFNP